MSRNWRRLGRWSDIAVAVRIARCTSAATRFPRLLFVRSLAVFLAPDCRRKDVERNGFATAVRARLTIVIVVVAGIVGGLLFAMPGATLAAAAVEALAALAAVFALLALLGRTLLFAGFDELVVTVVVIDILTALTPLIFEARAALAQHAEIMIRELQKIFGLDAVAGKLGVARHVLVFLEELRRIAALAIVLAVTRLSAEILSPLSPTAAPAAALSIVDQIPTSLRSGS